MSERKNLNKHPPCPFCGVQEYVGDMPSHKPDCEQKQINNMTNTKEKWVMEFYEKFGANKIWVNPSKENVETIFDIESFISKVRQEAKEETEKAFGGCKRCYGKGYCTVKAQAGSRRTGYWELFPYSPCTCDRGKQIKQLITTLSNKVKE